MPWHHAKMYLEGFEAEGLVVTANGTLPTRPTGVANNVRKIHTNRATAAPGTFRKIGLKEHTLVVKRKG